MILKKSIFKNRIGIKGQKSKKQVRNQRSIEENKDAAQVLLENERNS